jgi:hypothetical protein
MPPADDDHVTREQLARVLGRDERTIRRWERTRLAPAVTVGPDGVHRFDVQRVRELIEVRETSSPRRADAYDGETAARVFALFAEGVNPDDVVIRLKLNPVAVEAMHDKWLRLRGAFVVPQPITARIDPRLGYRSTAEKLLKFVEEPRSTQTCCECEAPLPERSALCPECAGRMSLKEARRRAVAAEMQQHVKEMEMNVAASCGTPRRMLGCGEIAWASL